MSHVTLVLEDLVVAIDAAPAHVAWLAELTGARPTSASDRSPDATVVLTFDSRQLRASAAETAGAPLAASFTFDQGGGWLPRATRGDGTRVAYDAESRIAYVTGGGACSVIADDESSEVVGHARLAMLRMVRELQQHALADHGFTLVHAAAVARDGRVVLIAGPRRTGKTTLLAYLLRHGQAAYVSNDRTALGPTRRAVGIATLVSVRPDTFRLVHGLPPIPWERQARPRRAMAELAPGADHDGGIRDRPTALSPAQLWTWLGAPPEQVGEAVAVVFPEPGDGDGPPILERLERERATARLAAAVMPLAANGLLGPPPRATPPPSLPAHRCILGGYPPDAATGLLDALFAV